MLLAPVVQGRGAWRIYLQALPQVKNSELRSQLNLADEDVPQVRGYLSLCRNPFPSSIPAKHQRVVACTGMCELWMLGTAATFAMMVIVAVFELATPLRVEL